MNNKINYEEFFVTDGNGNMRGYYKTYEEAVSVANEQTQSKIYGACWTPSKFNGLLHREWVEITA